MSISCLKLNDIWLSGRWFGYIVIAERGKMPSPFQIRLQCFEWHLNVLFSAYIATPINVEAVPSSSTQKDADLIVCPRETN
ncbi:hypothetical protein K443DRAFT_218842 [Laccaria amethystina LaAM-08-1]|uniref:Uncharacterized protein n=1 Tax=Laccaria amethystina LaAM-08-1 TaxID=1095629 RepID=A0A0C9X9P9_9AGAR|nr:hypothetical protein K443DRAFT_218842 [Laccaria amethystina LaAM-08-1]